MPSVSTKNDASRPARYSSTTSRAGVAEAAIDHRRARPPLGRSIRRHDDALTGRQAVGLQDDRKAELRRARAARAPPRPKSQIAVARRRHAVPAMKSFANTLLDSSAAAALPRAEKQPAFRAKQVGDAATERELGSDDGEVDAARARRAPGSRRGRRCRRRRTGRAAAMPALPGAQTISATWRSPASFQTSACSRAPPRPRGFSSAIQAT